MHETKGFHFISEIFLLNSSRNIAFFYKCFLKVLRFFFFFFNCGYLPYYLFVNLLLYREKTSNCYGIIFVMLKFNKNNSWYSHCYRISKIIFLVMWFICITLLKLNILKLYVYLNTTAYSQFLCNILNWTLHVEYLKVKIEAVTYTSVLNLLNGSALDFEFLVEWLVAIAY